MKSKIYTPQEAHMAHAKAMAQLAARTAQVKALRKTNTTLSDALTELLNILPADVLRMKAGNAFLDMERADLVITKARAAIKAAEGKM